ncbi:MAG: DNA-binding protein [Acidobacteriia bacterium]|nr:DNA-binding protein [Terriglobia bacterium]
MIKPILLGLAAAVLVCGQETRREIVNRAPTPADDAKPSSDNVPDVYAVSGRFERVVTLRFKFDTDLLAGLEKIVKQEKIRNAVILAGAGSVRGYQVHADLIGMNGYVIDGKIHAHVTLANPDKAFGGHLEAGTTVFTFAIVTLGVLDASADLSRMDDKTYR